MARPFLCPRFYACNSPICPLDPDHPKAVHLPGESVCLYLREAVKPGGREILGGALPDKLVEEVYQAIPGIVSEHGDIRRTLERAKYKTSKVRAGQILRGIA